MTKFKGASKGCASSVSAIRYAQLEVLAMVQSRKSAAVGFSFYADSFTYNAAGALTSMQFGNGKWESTQFNTTLQ
ncbi:MAG: hypothetical protein ABIV48_11165 [Pyrinomonadaceae bacterium]